MRSRGTLNERQAAMRTRVTRAVAAKVTAKIAAKAAVTRLAAEARTVRLAERQQAANASATPPNNLYDLKVKNAGGVLIDWPLGPLD
jgi:hypothetical protein